ncbi:MAG: VCBS repeat-containing protein, partial [Verrucomicrobiae bacterium]|nr:VCBS repeat-containing protein [Verrucomicrobiae bacterium]
HKWPDILVASFHATRRRDLSLFLNLHDEGIFKPEYFEVPQEGIGYERQVDGDGLPVFHRPGLTSVAVGDVNRDGLRDAVAAGWSSDVVVYFPGHAEKYFAEPVLIPVPGGPFSIALADLNHDGHLDFAVTLMATNEVSVWQGDGTGGFKEADRFSSRGLLPHRLEVADINQDGQKDLVVSHKHVDDTIVIFYGSGRLSFRVSQEIMLGTDRNVMEKNIQDIAVGDFNGDGFPDIAAACFASGEVMVLTADNSKNKAFLEFNRKSYTFKDGQPRALCAADLNLNGKTDLAVALWGLNAVGLLLSE